MIRTPFCELLGIEHPLALGGMGSIFAPAMVAAVSEAIVVPLGQHFLRAVAKNDLLGVELEIHVRFLDFVVVQRKLRGPAARQWKESSRIVS